MTGTGARRGVALVAVVLLLAATGCSEDRSADGTTAAGQQATTPAACTGDDLLACARLSTIAELVPDSPTKAEGEPIVIGMVNQENTPAGSFPELTRAAQVGVDFFNEQLGGIGGRPLQLEVCNTKFSAEGSTACGQQFVDRGVPVVLGGIDIFGTAIEVLESNGIPYVGGIPVSDQSARSANSFQFSGGIWGATVAFAHHAATVDQAKSVAIVYGEFGPIAEAAQMGKDALAAQGITDVQLIPHPIIATDLSAPIQVATASNPDAIFMLEADMGCKGAFDGIANSGTTAKVFYVGACAAPSIVDQAGPDKTDGARFNVESSVDMTDPDPDTAFYVAAADHYAPGFDAIGAGTVAFKSIVNLYAVLHQLGPDGVDAAAITQALRSQKATPSFMGHDYTCDGQQFGPLTALCSPQQILVELQGGQLRQLGDWIDVGAVLRG